MTDTNFSRRRFVWSAAAGGLVLTTAMPRPSLAQAKRRLRYVGFAAKNSLLSQPYAEFARQVDARSGGELQIDWIGGTEVVGAMQAVAAISKGVFDIVLTGAAYYAGAVPEGTVLQSGKASRESIYKSGAFDLLDQIHQQKINAVLLGIVTGGVGFTFMARHPPANLESFKGKRFRSMPLLDPILTALGAAPVTIGPSEVYTALERGVVDGLGWPEFAIKEYGFHTRAKYLMRPSFYTVRSVHLINRQTFEKLPPPLQQVLRDASKVTGDWAEKLYRDNWVAEVKAMKDEGLQEVSLPQNEAQRFLKLTEDEMWKKVAEFAPQNQARLRELFGKAEAMG